MNDNKKKDFLGSSLIVIIFILVMALILKKDWNKIVDFNSNMSWGVFWGVFTYFIFSWMFSRVIFFDYKIKDFIESIIDELHFVIMLIVLLIIILFPIFQILLFIFLLIDKNLQLLFISPNYLFVKIHKSNIEIKEDELDNKEKEDNPLKEYIISLNKWNLIISMILFIIVSVISLLELSNTSQTSLLFYTVFYFIIYRSISRSVEIIISFGKDAISSGNKSNFNAFDRVKLAINSYLETLINFATSYYFIFDFDSKASIIDALIMSLGINTITNVPKEIGGTQILSINMLFIYLQVLTVLSLVILSIAMYASGKKGGKNE